MKNTANLMKSNFGKETFACRETRTIKNKESFVFSENTIGCYFDEKDGYFYEKIGPCEFEIAAERHLFKKTPKNVVFYLINSGWVSFSDGDSIEVFNPAVPQWQSEPFFIQYKASFKVENSEVFIREVLTETTYRYSEDFVTETIKNKVKIYIKSEVKKNFENFKISDIDSRYVRIKQRLEEILCESVGVQFGVSIVFNDIKVIEHPLFKEKKNHIEDHKIMNNE